MTREMITITREEYEELRKFKEADKELLLDVEMLCEPCGLKSADEHLECAQEPKHALCFSAGFLTYS